MAKNKLVATDETTTNQTLPIIGENEGNPSTEGQNDGTNESDKAPIDGASEKPDNEGDKAPDTSKPIEVETSEKLEAILADQDALMEKFSTEKDRSKKLELLDKINASQDAEKAERNAIKKAKADRELQAKRNERIALIDSMLLSYDAYNAFLREYNEIPEVEKEGEAGVMVKPAEATARLDALYHEYKNGRESIENELLARVGIKVATSTPVSGGTSNDEVGERGAKSKAIVEMYVENRGKGMTDTENVKSIIKAGYNDGTVGAAVVAYRRKNNLEPIK